MEMLLTTSPHCPPRDPHVTSVLHGFSNCWDIVAQLDECIRINEPPQVTAVRRRDALLCGFTQNVMSCLDCFFSLARASLAPLVAPHSRSIAGIVCAKTSLHELKACVVFQLSPSSLRLLFSNASPVLEAVVTSLRRFRSYCSKALRFLYCLLQLVNSNKRHS